MIINNLMSSLPYKVVKRKIPSSSDKTCGITLDDIDDDDRYMCCNVCRKNFFSEAIMKWLREGTNTCPNCRQVWDELVEFINVSGNYIYSMDELENNSKATLVLFYAKWCKKSNELLSIFEELKNRFENAQVEIKMFDFSNNGVDAVFEYNVLGFPTIRYYKNGTEYQNQYVEYDFSSDDDLDGLVVFLGNNIKN